VKSRPPLFCIGHFIGKEHTWSTRAAPLSSFICSSRPFRPQRFYLCRRGVTETRADAIRLRPTPQRIIRFRVYLAREIDRPGGVSGFLSAHLFSCLPNGISVGR